MDLGIKGRKAIVCASSRGLGRGCAEALAEAGVDIVINGLDETRLKQTAQEISDKWPVAVTPVAADLASPDGQAALLGACPNPDILVNNNGGPPFKDFRKLDRAAMLAGVTMNMITPIELIQAVIDGMTKRGFGRIVNITSISVKMPLTGLDLSSGSRAGLTAFLAGICRPVANKNVTINNILPGVFNTDRIRGGYDPSSGKTIEEFVAERAENVPAKRLGDPAEFGKLCAFLSSEHAGYITGQNFLIDGGLFNGTF
jgi:3-oxoacyl-[acyl-carrier protein] reductase